MQGNQHGGRCKVSRQLNGLVRMDTRYSGPRFGALNGMEFKVCRISNRWTAEPMKLGTPSYPDRQRRQLII